MQQFSTPQKKNALKKLDLIDSNKVHNISKILQAKLSVVSSDI